MVWIVNDLVYNQYNQTTPQSSCLMKKKRKKRESLPNKYGASTVVRSDAGLADHERGIGREKKKKVKIGGQKRHHRSRVRGRKPNLEIHDLYLNGKYSKKSLKCLNTVNRVICYEC